MSAPLVQFGSKGYALRRNPTSNRLMFTLNGQERATGLEYNDIVIQLALELEALQKLYVSNLDQGAEQARHIESLEKSNGRLIDRTPRMDVLMVRCKEWHMRTYGESVTDDEVGRMFDYCLQGHYIPKLGQPIAMGQAAAERSEAQMDADIRGMGFIVHGVRVSPNDVTVLGGVDVVDRMRAATQAAADTLSEFRAERAREESVELEKLRKCYADAVELMNKRAEAMDWINDFLGFGQGPDTSVDAACAWTLAGVRRVNKQLNEHEVEAATVGPRLAQLCTLVGLTPPSDKPAELYDMAFAILGMVNGKLRRSRETVWCDAPIDPDAPVYDPRFLQPITPDAPGESKACGVCGAIHSNDGLFCDLHLTGE